MLDDDDVGGGVVLSFQKTNLNIGYTVACGEIGVGSDREGEGVGRDREEGRGRKGSGD